MLTKNPNAAGIIRNKVRIIEDEWTRTIKFRKEKLKELKQYKKAGAPKGILDQIEKEAEMTHGEYQIYVKDMENQWEKKKRDFVAANPIQKDLVDALYNKAETIEYNFHPYTSLTIWLYYLKPVEIIGKDAFQHEVYDAIIDHTWELYKEKYKENFSKEEPL